MDTQEDKPKVRVVKAGKQRLKSGLIRSEGEGGTVYRGPCDRCQAIVTTRKPPRPEDELLCKPCTYVAKVGKPSTKVKRKGDRVVSYFTECDICGDVGKTPFLPKKSRPYLCDLCFKEEEATRRAEERARAEELAAAEAEAELEAAWAAADALDAAADAAEAASLAPEQHAASGEMAEAAPDAAASAEPAPAETTSAETARDEDVAAASDAAASADALDGDTEPAPTDDQDSASEPAASAPKVDTLYHLNCRRCRTKLTLKFKPERGERFICPDCFEKERTQDEEKRERRARLLFNIECAACGKKETVDFVPKSLSETICTDCFDKRRRK